MEIRMERAKAKKMPKENPKAGDTGNNGVEARTSKCHIGTSALELATDVCGLFCIWIWNMFQTCLNLHPNWMILDLDFHGICNFVVAVTS